MNKFKIDDLALIINRCSPKTHKCRIVSDLETSFLQAGCSHRVQLLDPKFNGTIIDVSPVRLIPFGNSNEVSSFEAIEDIWIPKLEPLTK